MAPLDPDHEAHARELAQLEVRSFVRLLADEVASAPARADGNLNGRDFWQSLNRALERFDRGEVA